MLKMMLSQYRNPLAWAIVLLCAGAALSVVSQAEGHAVRAVQQQDIRSGNGCIPIMEQTKEGAPTGRLGCATQQQAIDFCEALLRTSK
jgi:hypothetical protein